MGRADHRPEDGFAVVPKDAGAPRRPSLFPRRRRVSRLTSAASLGAAGRADIRVRLPDGEWSPTYRAGANQFVVDRAKPQAAYRYAGR